MYYIMTMWDEKRVGHSAFNQTHIGFTCMLSISQFCFRAQLNS